MATSRLWRSSVLSRRWSFTLSEPAHVEGWSLTLFFCMKWDGVKIHFFPCGYPTVPALFIKMTVIPYCSAEPPLSSVRCPDTSGSDSGLPVPFLWSEIRQMNRSVTVSQSTKLKSGDFNTRICQQVKLKKIQIKERILQSEFSVDRHSPRRGPPCGPLRRQRRSRKRERTEEARDSGKSEPYFL